MIKNINSLLILVLSISIGGARCVAEDNKEIDFSSEMRSMRNKKNDKLWESITVYEKNKVKIIEKINPYGPMDQQGDHPAIWVEYYYRGDLVEKIRNDPFGDFFNPQILIIANGVLVMTYHEEENEWLFLDARAHFISENGDIELVFEKKFKAIFKNNEDDDNVFCQRFTFYEDINDKICVFLTKYLVNMHSREVDLKNSGFVTSYEIQLGQRAEKQDHAIP